MTARPRSRSALLVVLAIAACWPAWRWYALRMAQVPGEMAALVPLGIALAIVLRAARPAPEPPSARSGLLSGALVLYAAAYHFVPPIVRAFFAVLALGIAATTAAGGRGIRPGVLLLLALALPVVPTAQFYLGCPLRIVAGEVSSWMLTASGFDVVRSGTLLDWGGRLVAVDVACSGVRMLWTGLLVASAIAAARDFGWVRTVALSLLSLVAVVAGNVVRTVALFFPEANVVKLPSWGHEAVGLVSFALVVWIIIAASRARPIARKPCPAG